MPSLCFNPRTRKGATKRIASFYLRYFDFSIHLDADRDVLFARRVWRDVEQYGYSYEKVKAVFEQSMRDYETFGTYGKEHADISLVSNDCFRLEIRRCFGDLRL